MALVPIKTSAGTGYCECIHGCYELVSLRDDETGKSYCPACAKDHLEMNRGLGLPRPAPSRQADTAPAEPLASYSAATAPAAPGEIYDSGNMAVLGCPVINGQSTVV